MALGPPRTAAEAGVRPGGDRATHDDETPAGVVHDHEHDARAVEPAELVDHRPERGDDLDDVAVDCLDDCRDDGDHRAAPPAVGPVVGLDVDVGAVDAASRRVQAGTSASRRRVS